MFRYSCIYVNRSCPRKCEYCSERDAPLRGRELTESEWEKVVTHLDSLGIKFHLFLGNDCLLMGEDFLKLVNFLKGRQDYAFYSSFQPALFNKYRDRLLPAGLYNLSGGIDVLSGDDDIAEKSADGLFALTWLKKQGIPDCQGTITLGKHNISQCEKVVKTLSERGIWAVVNVVHWDTDGKFDFFPKRNLKYALEDTPELRDLISRLKDGIIRGEYMLQCPPEYLDGILEWGINQNWHCSKPIVTVDADSSLRTCGYRPGKYLPNYSVLDLGNELSVNKYMEIWESERLECPGCYWGYPIMAEFDWYGDKEFADKVFREHASKFRR